MAATRKELMVTVAMLAAIPVFTEVALRVAGASFDPQLYAPNRELGWVLRPGARGVVSVETKQYVEINSHGFRDHEHSYDKPQDTVRIAILGNSWTEALQVPLEKTYTGVLQRLLSGSSCFSGERVEVLNFGVAGYSTAQELLLLRREVWKYRPDMILLAFYPARDVANNVRELNNAVTPERSPYFVFRGDGLVLDESFRGVPALQPRQIALQNTTYLLSQHSRTLQGVFALQRGFLIRVAMAAQKERAQQAGVDNLEYDIYAPPVRPEMQSAWRITEALFIAMRDEVASHQAEFRIVTLATRPQVIPDPAKRAELMRKFGVSNLDYADDRIREFGKRENISVMRLAPALLAYAQKQNAYLNGFSARNFGSGHWNETGHRLVAETIAAELCGNEPKVAVQAKETSR